MASSICLREPLVWMCMILLSILNLMYSVDCLYQDQVGKFDWRRQFIGIPRFVYYHQGADNIIIGTESNVIASLHVKDGSILWRQLFPKECNLNHMSILKSGEDIRDYLVRTSCVNQQAQSNQTDHWNPLNGLLVSAGRYRDFIEDGQAETVIVEVGHKVGDANVFELSQDSNLVISNDGTVTYQSRDQPIWSREESLASIVAVEILKLPVDMRDSFGLRKMIVALTRSGKLFGMDTFSGDVIWDLFEKDLATNTHESIHARLILTRQSDVDASESQAIVVHPKGYILNLNPISGTIIERMNLPRSLQQIALTEIYTSDSSRGVILLDTQNEVHVYPPAMIDHVKSDINKYYITVAQAKPATLTGYKFSLESNSILPKVVWTLPINETETIVSLSIKRIDEEIHSPARVLGDRGILYKYVNPNLMAIMTEGNIGDPCAPEQSIQIYLVDGVTGALVHYIHHPKSRGPATMVHSENWLVYSYYNTKSRRTEVSSLEMFEGINQLNSSTFSSLTRSHIKPRIIEHKSFIFPSGIDAMIDTVTLRGMTNKHIIVALPSGGLLEIPKIFLDPRRPINMLMEHREEGLIPYMPELPIPSESTLNYYQTLLAVRKIVTSPAILESTSLVFAYGLDLFFTRVTPSKTFDILKDDFDHVLISGVLIFLVVASLISKYLAQRKALHAAWK